MGQDFALIAKCFLKMETLAYRNSTNVAILVNNHHVNAASEANWGVWVQGGSEFLSLQLDLALSSQFLNFSLFQDQKAAAA